MTESPPSLSAARLFVVFVLIAGCGESEYVVPDDGADELLRTGVGDTPFITEGIETPELVDAALDSLAPDTQVIGVVYESEARAYTVRSMSGATTHVVNDRFGEKPISITYCDQTDCARVLTTASGAGDREIKLQTGGFADGEMLLRLKEQMYPHSSTDIPLEDYPFELTTWQEWIAVHPKTRLFDTERLRLQ